MSIYSSTKTCPRCKKDKNIIDFSKDKYQPDGLQNRCKSCDHIYGQNRKLKSRYGISSDDVKEMLKSQNGKCGICNEETDLCVDHDHNKQGKESVRMLLCKSCNLVLGYAKDNIDILQKSINYLKKYK